MSVVRSLVVSAAAVAALVAAAPALAQQFKIEGQVKMEDGSPVQGATFEVLPTDVGSARSERTAKVKKNGSFTMPFVDFGTYKFRVQKEGLLMGHLSVRILTAQKQVENEYSSDIPVTQELPQFKIDPGRTVEIDVTMVPESKFASEVAIPGDKEGTDKLLKANTLSGEGKFEESNKILNELLDSGAATANLYYLLGRNSYSLGDVASAKKWLEKSLELNPSQPGANAQLGAIAYAEGQKDEAVERFRKEIEVSPDAVPVGINYAVLLEELGRTDEAAKAFEHVIEMAPGEVSAYMELANLYTSAGEEDKAQAVLSKMEQHATPSAALWFNLGAGFSNKDRYDQAEAAYRKALDIDPTFPQALREMGYLMVRKGDHAAAIDFFKRYLDASPGASDADQIRGILTALEKQSGG